MTNAMIWNSCTGLIRAIGLLLSGIISVEFINSPLFSTTSGSLQKIGLLLNIILIISELIVLAMGFIFFISFDNYQPALRRSGATQDDVFADNVLQKLINRL